MRKKVGLCFIGVAGGLALAALVGILAVPGTALAAKPVCGDGKCQGNEPTTCPQDCGGGGEKVSVHYWLSLDDPLEVFGDQLLLFGRKRRAE